MGWDDNVEFELLSDAQTEAEAKTAKDSGQPASYLIVRRDDNGQFRMETESDGLPKRFVFEPNTDLIESQRENVLLRNLEEKASRMKGEQGTGSIPGLGGMGALPGKAPSKELLAVEDEIEELRQQRRRRSLGAISNAPQNQPALQFEENFGMGGDNQ